MAEDANVAKMIDQSLIHVKEGPDRGRIEDVDAARELAEIESEKVDARIGRERELAEGLTEEQKEHLRAIEFLPGKYPHAFVLDSDGTPVRHGRDGSHLITRPLEGHRMMVITKDGVVEIAEDSFHTPVSEEFLRTHDVSGAVAAAEKGVKALTWNGGRERVILGEAANLRGRAETLSALFKAVEGKYKDRLETPLGKPDLKDIL